jgi:hypothetical protein
VEGALNQVAGTVPVLGPPGEANDGIAPLVVATSVEPAGAGSASLDGTEPLLVVGGAVLVDSGPGRAVFPLDLLHAGSSTQMASAARTATRHRRLTSPATAGPRT